MSFNLPPNSSPDFIPHLAGLLNPTSTPAFLMSPISPHRAVSRSCWPSGTFPLAFKRSTATMAEFNSSLCHLVVLLLSFLFYAQQHNHPCRPEFSRLFASLLDVFRHRYLRRFVLECVHEFKARTDNSKIFSIPIDDASIWPLVNDHVRYRVNVSDALRYPKDVPAEVLDTRWLTPEQGMLYPSSHEAWIVVSTNLGQMILLYNGSRFILYPDDYTCDCLHAEEGNTFSTEVARVVQMLQSCPHTPFVHNENVRGNIVYPPFVSTPQWMTKGSLESAHENLLMPALMPYPFETDSEDDQLEFEAPILDDPSEEEEEDIVEEDDDDTIPESSVSATTWRYLFYLMTVMFLVSKTNGCEPCSVLEPYQYSFVPRSSELLARAMASKPERPPQPHVNAPVTRYRPSKTTTHDRNVIKEKYGEDQVDNVLKELRELKATISHDTRNEKRNYKAYRERTHAPRMRLREYSNNLPQDLISRADDMPVFAATGRSEYIRCVFAPDTGPAQIPDDVVQQCHVKAETVTYNLDVAESGSGVLLLLPEHPTDVIGYHYFQNSMGQMVFDRTLRTAQNLPDNYDYARRVSQLLTIKSSTIPSGVYALNGTFNAVRVEGTLSEIPSLSLSGDDFYNGILTNTVEVLDKVGNVLVGDGLAVLSLMGTIDQPFTRLGDTSPVSVELATTLENAILDLSESLLYHYVASGIFALTPAPTKNLALTINLDSTNGIEIDFAVHMNFIQAPSPNYSCCVIADFNFLDPFGNTIFVPFETAYEQQLNFSAVQEKASAHFHVSFQNYNGPPIAAIEVTVQGQAANTVDGSAFYHFDATVPAAARLGVNRPVTVVAYQGVAGGSVLTVGGVTNFELIPNPVLRQNLQLSNGYADENELEYAKNLLHKRHQIGLKSVWKLQDYWAMRPALEELCDVTKTDQAVAFGRSDLLKFLKNKFLPAVAKPLTQVLSNSMPQFAPAFDVLGSALTSRAASGRPVAYRAMDVKPTHAKQKKGVIAQPSWRLVMFPTIITPPGSFVMKGAELFAVSTVKPKKMSFPVATKSIDGYNIYGISEDSPYHLPIGRDLWVFAIDPSAAVKREVRIIHGEPVSGTSAEAAIFMAAYGNFKGIFPTPITGELDDKLNVIRNPAFQEKMRWLAARGLNLAGNDPDAKPKIVNLIESKLISDRKTYGSVPANRK